MQISIAPLRIEDARAVVDADDEHTVRWLSEGESTVEGTAAFIAQLVHDAENGKAKRAFGIWLDGRCVGTVDCDPDVTDGREPGDVNVAYGVAPEARGRGVAMRAVDLVCDQILERGVGRRAVIRADARNHASTRVAEKAGFTYLRDIRIAPMPGAGGEPEVLRVYGRELA